MTVSSHESDGHRNRGISAKFEKAKVINKDETQKISNPQVNGIDPPLTANKTPEEGNNANAGEDSSLQKDKNFMTDTNSAKESLFASNTVVLFGRTVDDLTVKDEGLTDADKAKKGKRLIRVYGVTYDGIYSDLLSPVLFLVKGDGKATSEVPLPGPNPRNKEFYADLRAWTVERTDDTVRLDVDQGKFEDLLVELGGDDMSGISGARVSGARVSGARVSGARVSGARVSGARISGARGDASD